MSDTAVRKQASKGGWQRLSLPKAICEPPPQPAREPRATRSETAARSISTATVKELTDRGRNIILALMDELEFLNGNHQTLVDMVEDYVNGEKDDRTRFKLVKALDHETRSKTANYLATALAKLNDAAPGKKEAAQSAAETAGQDGGWGDDLDAGGPPAKFN